MPRKQCACGCGEWFSGKGRQQFADDTHYRQSAFFRGQVQRAMAHARKAKLAHVVEALAGLGTLTEREQWIYRRGHTNGYSAGRQMGRRHGFREALGERDGAGIGARRGLTAGERTRT